MHLKLLLKDDTKAKPTMYTLQIEWEGFTLDFSLLFRNKIKQKFSVRAEKAAFCRRPIVFVQCGNCFIYCKTAGRRNEKYLCGLFLF